MILLSLLFPTLIVMLCKPKLMSWNLIRLFAGYLMIYGFLGYLTSHFELTFFSSFLIAAVFAFTEAANVEHIINNDSNQSVTFIRFLFDPVFMKGSGITKRFVLRLSLLILMTFLVMQIQVNMSPVYYGFILMGGILLAFAIPRSSSIPDWLQECWQIQNLKILFTKEVTRAPMHLPKDVEYSAKLLKANSLYDQIIRRDTGTDKWIQNRPDTNILLIMIEGAGELHLKNGWMPNLKKRSESGISVKTFISHQRNTNRGVYSVLSGKHPNLVSQIAKPDLVAQYGKMEKGLAEYLSEKNFKTIFVQGAPTVFMSKDRFLPQMGFQEVFGEEHFEKSVPRIKWGVDDRALYDFTFAKLKSLNQATGPWFMSLLTVSTHHPFQASDKKLNNPEEGFRYADEMLEFFLRRAENEGLLNNTVVFITSDEVAGDSSNFLTHNLGPLAVITPEKIQKEISVPFGQSDIAYSICDYLGFEDHPFVGRSIFRTYESQRPLYFANIFHQKAFCFHNKNLLVKHYSGKTETLTCEELSLHSPLESSSNADFTQFNELLEANDRDLSFLTNPVLMNVQSLAPKKTGETVSTGGAIKVGLKTNEGIKLQFSGDNLRGSRPVVVLWLIQDMKNKRSFKLNTLMTPGQAKKYEKVFISEEDAWYDLTVKVTAPEETNWSITDLQISLESEQKIS